MYLCRFLFSFFFFFIFVLFGCFNLHLICFTRTDTPSFAISRTPGFGYPLREGIEVSLKCDVDSNPPSTPIWQKDDGDPPVIVSCAQHFRAAKSEQRKKKNENGCRFHVARCSPSRWTSATATHQLLNINSSVFVTFQLQIPQIGDGFLNFTQIRREHSGWYKCTSRHLNFQYSSIGYFLNIRCKFSFHKIQTFHNLNAP